MLRHLQVLKQNFRAFNGDHAYMSHRLRKVLGQEPSVRRSAGAERVVVAAAAGLTTGQSGPRMNIWRRTRIRRMLDASLPSATVGVLAVRLRRQPVPWRWSA